MLSSSGVVDAFDALVCSIGPTESPDPSVEELGSHLEILRHRSIRMEGRGWRRRTDQQGSNRTLPRDAVRAVNHIVLEDGHDLVVVRDEVVWPSGWLRRLLRSCPCSVLVQRSRRTEATDVLAAVDPRHGAERTQRILASSAGIARRLDGELHLAHGWNANDEMASKGVFTFTPPVPQAEVAARTVAERHDALEQLAAQVGNVRVGQVHLAQGTAAEVVERATDRHRFGMVVVGASHREGLSGRMRVSTPVEVLGLVDCPVLVLKTPA